VVDLAVAVVIGTAFKGIVDALVKDLITPLIAAIGGQPDFSAVKFTINGSQFLIGDFINAIVAALDRLLQANASAGTLRPDLDSGDVVLASSPGGELARADRTALAERERGVHQREVAERLGKVAELAAGHRVVLLCEQTDVVA